ncbi:MAG: hypothetical protein IPG04_38450 [Polyangiaceae bacterium]|nr:hypothetical protein [Polyangiaceae bacterium]
MFSRTMGGALGVSGLGAVLAAPSSGERVPSDVTSALLDPHERERVLAILGWSGRWGNPLQPVFVSCAVAAGLALLRRPGPPRRAFLTYAPRADIRRVSPLPSARSASRVIASPAGTPMPGRAHIP